MTKKKIMTSSFILPFELAFKVNYLQQQMRNTVILANDQSILYWDSFEYLLGTLFYEWKYGIILGMRVFSLILRVFQHFCIQISCDCIINVCKLY